MIVFQENGLTFSGTLICRGNFPTSKYMVISNWWAKYKDNSYPEVLMFWLVTFTTHLYKNIDRHGLSFINSCTIQGSNYRSSRHLLLIAHVGFQRKMCVVSQGDSTYKLCENTGKSLIQLFTYQGIHILLQNLFVNWILSRKTFCELERKTYSIKARRCLAVPHLSHHFLICLNFKDVAEPPLLV